ncbi:MAG: SipW-dependent-type signal peptide-containing protein [Halodesulfurarchaeum sp.]
MTEEKPQLYRLSRRKMLGGLGAIGLASAGAGLGTSALFSDTETFEDNSLTAGTLDMSVTAEIVAANDYWADSIGLTETADSAGVTAGLQVDDVKPGDWAIICFDVEVSDNPGYLQVRTESFEEDGGANPEPEQVAEGDAENNADLGEFLLTTVWQEYDESGEKAGLSTLDPVFNLASDDLGISYGEPDIGGLVDEDTHYTNAREADSILASGYLVKDNEGAPAVVNEGEEGYSFCLLLEIPVEVGNVIQGDGLGFDLVFETEQVRNNPAPFNTTVENETSEI